KLIIIRISNSEPYTMAMSFKFENQTLLLKDSFENIPESIKKFTLEGKTFIFKATTDKELFTEIATKKMLRNNTIIPGGTYTPETIVSCIDEFNEKTKIAYIHLMNIIKKSFMNTIEKKSKEHLSAFQNAPTIWKEKELSLANKMDTDPSKKEES